MTVERDDICMSYCCLIQLYQLSLKDNRAAEPELG